MLSEFSDSMLELSLRMRIVLEDLECFVSFLCLADYVTVCLKVPL